MPPTGILTRPLWHPTESSSEFSPTYQQPTWEWVVHRFHCPLNPLLWVVHEETCSSFCHPHYFLCFPSEELVLQLYLFFIYSFLQLEKSVHGTWKKFNLFCQMTAITSCKRFQEADNDILVSKGLKKPKVPISGRYKSTSWAIWKVYMASTLSTKLEPLVEFGWINTQLHI